jgi:hypothetical protein
MSEIWVQIEPLSHDTLSDDPEPRRGVKRVDVSVTKLGVEASIGRVHTALTEVERVYPAVTITPKDGLLVVGYIPTFYPEDRDVEKLIDFVAGRLEIAEIKSKEDATMARAG